MSEPNNLPIRPELLAQKLSRAFNFELPEFLEELEAHPRLAEILWTLQWVSIPENYRGGLERFVRDMLEECGHLIDCPSPDVFSNWESRPIWDLIDSLLTVEPTIDEVRGKIFEAAISNLPGYLRLLCERPDIRLATGGLWTLVGIEKVVLAFIDRRAERLASELAETEVTRLVFRWIAKAHSTGRAVKIVGSTRFGKTEAVRLFARMRPGIARLVNTPASNTEGDLLREVARALGIQESRRRLFELRATIDTVLRSFRPVLIIDESQFLFPTSFSRNSQPPRLNWYRRAVVDIGIPSVLVETPQSSKVRNAYVRATGFVIEQVEERILKTVRLPDELSEADLLAVARIHLPDLDARYLSYVVTVTLAAERNFVSDLEKIGTLARDHAVENGRKTPILIDIKAAIADVLPTVTTRESAARPVAAPVVLSDGDASMSVPRGRSKVARAKDFSLPPRQTSPASSIEGASRLACEEALK